MGAAHSMRFCLRNGLRNAHLFLSNHANRQKADTENKNKTKEKSPDFTKNRLKSGLGGVRGI